MADYLLGIARRWALILCCVALAAGAAAVYTWRSEQRYVSSARIFLGFETPSSGTLYYVAISMPDVEALVESTEFAESVADSLGDDVDPGSLATAVDAGVEPDTTVLRITATDGSPVRARDIAGAYVETLHGAAVTKMFGQADDVQIVTRVTDPPGVASPRGRPWWRNLVAGAAAGLLLGIVLAAVRAARSATP